MSASISDMSSEGVNGSCPWGSLGSGHFCLLAACTEGKTLDVISPTGQGREGILCSKCRDLDAWISGQAANKSVSLEEDEPRNVVGVRLLSLANYAKV